jgi:Tfp pilus assembly protein PilX
MPNNRGAGSLLILVFILMVSMSLFVSGLIFIAGMETRDTGFGANDYRVLHLADAGVDRALRQLRTDYLTSTQTGTTDLRGADTTLSVSVTSATNMMYIDSSSATLNANTDQAIVRTFDSNYTQARITSVLFFVSASGNGDTMQLSYTTDGTNYVNAGSAFSGLTGSLLNYSRDITGSLTWATIMSPNFRLRVMRTGGSSNLSVNAIWLRVTYEIDTNTESWFTGAYASYPITLGDGTIQSVSIADESGKVHLNYATQGLLRYLMVERGVASATANTVATNIVSYRGAALTNPFDTVEELQRVTGMTQAIYDAIKNYVTVYSYINPYSYRPPTTGTVSRAPVNINTAPREVLEAIFDNLALDATDPASLATDIINTRATVPFTCFYSSNAAVTSDLYDFIVARAYLSTSGNPDQRDRVLDTADASSLIPISGSATYPNPATEFCYATTAFDVQSVGRAHGVNFRVTTKIKDDPRGGNIRTFYNYTGDTTAIGYRRENYE